MHKVINTLFLYFDKFKILFLLYYYYNYFFLLNLGLDFSKIKTYNVLEDKDLREGVKEYSYVQRNYQRSFIIKFLFHDLKYLMRSFLFFF
jgi:hypothetical protein